MAYVNSVRRVESGIASKITSIFHSLAERYAQARVYRTTVSEMSDLTDRDLADLGISRSMIHSIAYDAAYGK